MSNDARDRAAEAYTYSYGSERWSRMQAFKAGWDACENYQETRPRLTSAGRHIRNLEKENKELKAEVERLEKIIDEEAALHDEHDQWREQAEKLANGLKAIELSCIASIWPRTITQPLLAEFEKFKEKIK